MAFSDFLTSELDSLRLTPWLEMARGTELKEYTPMVPPMVRNILSSIRGGRAEQTDILQWIYRQGLHQATRGRKIMAEKATQELRNMLSGKIPPDRLEKVFIPEDKFFFTKAYPSMALRFGMNEQSFEEFMRAKVQEYFEKYEPKEIMVRNRGRGHTVIDLAKLNNHLKEMGVSEFRFGGDNGLIEYLENGPWARKDVGVEPYLTNDPIRHGVDLSNPVYGKDEPTNRFLHRYGNWNPPMDPKVYADIVDELKSHGGRKAHEYLKKLQDPNFQPDPNDEDDMEFVKWVQKLKERGELQSVGAEKIGQTAAGDQKAIQNVALLFGYHPKAYSPAKFPGGKWPVWNDTQLEFLLSCIKNTLEQKGIPEDQQKQMIDEITAGPPGTLKGYWKTKGGSKVGISGAINAGAAALGYNVAEVIKKGYAPQSAGEGGEATPTEYQRKLSGEDYAFQQVGYDKKPINIKDLLNDGWQWKKGEEPTPENSRGVLVKGDEEIDVERNKNGGWDVLVPNQERLPLKGSGTASLFGTSNIKRDPMSDEILSRRGVIAPHPDTRLKFNPANTQILNKLVDRWFGDKQAFGEPEGIDPDDRRRIPQMSNHMPASILKAALRAVRLSSGKTMASDDFLRKNVMEDLVSLAFLRMKDLISNKRFLYGDLDRTVRTGGGEDAEEQQETQAIKQLLAKNGVDDEGQQEKYIDYVRNVEDQGRMLRQKEIPENVLKAFLENGFRWRIYKVSRQLVNDAKKEIQQTVSGRSMEGSGEEGETYSRDPTEKDRPSNHESPLKSLIRLKAENGEFKLSPGGLSAHDVYAITRGEQPEELSSASAGKQPTLMSPAVEAEASPFKRQAMKQYPNLAEPTNWYHKQYAFVQNKIKTHSGRDDISYLDTLKNALEVGAYGQPEQILAAVDAVGDAIADKIKEICEKPELDQNDIQLATGIFHTFLMDNAPLSLAAKAKEVQFDVSQPVKSVRTYFAAHKKDLVQPIIQGFKPTAQAPEAAPPQKQPAIPMQKGAMPASTVGASYSRAATPLQAGNKVYYSPEDFATDYASAAPLQQAQLRRAAMLSGNHDYIQQLNAGPKKESMITFKQWQNQKIIKETDAIYDGSKPTTFNWWGSVGLPNGKVIDGEPIKNWTRKKKKNER